MNMKLIALVAILASSLATLAHAERADRDKPLNLEADKVTVDDTRNVKIFEGNVQLTQGTLVIMADKIVVTEDASGNQVGVATGGPGGLAFMKQKREGRSDYIQGWGDRIESDTKAEKSQLFGHARMLNGQDEVRGQYIAYDGKTENYTVTNGPNGTTVTGGKSERVHAVIQPKNKDDDKTTKPAPASK